MYIRETDFEGKYYTVGTYDDLYNKTGNVRATLY